MCYPPAPESFSAVARNAISMALVIGTALLAGFSPHADPVHWLNALGLLLLFMVAISWVAVCLGLLARSAEGASGFTFAICSCRASAARSFPPRRCRPPSAPSPPTNRSRR
ncbi:hypothetical protein [Rhizomonospora bruguierae]|uniref:hypothetical protein n=1 Tax=Rhizomonospora bruguierae TaxID=1581705 RepID=UPI001BCF5902|nr:hypothetical protein [Micromonospora sp. NBRC 107566]